MPGHAAAPVTVHTMVAIPHSRRTTAGLRLFETIRDGFPTARLSIVDNNSCAAAEAALAAAAARVDGRVRRVTVTMSEYGFLSDVILNPGNTGPTVIVDTGVVFWDNCEGWTFDGLIAGRLIPRFFEDGGCISLPRLHPSFWWIPDVAALRDRILRAFNRSRLGYLDAFAPYMWRDVASGIWYRNDVGANLYAAMRDEACAFEASELDAFDCAGLVTAADEEVPAGDGAIRGQWRAQDDYFRVRAVPTVPAMVFGQ
jgi:hypothetical protein